MPESSPPWATGRSPVLLAALQLSEKQASLPQVHACPLSKLGFSEGHSLQLRAHGARGTLTVAFTLQVQQGFPS